MNVVPNHTLFQKFLIGISLLLFVMLGWWVAQNYDAAQQLIVTVGWWGPVVAILLYGLLSLTPIPSDPITLMCGALYGLEMGILISWIGNTLAALVEYVVFKDVSVLTNFSAKKTKLPKWLKRFPVHSVWFLIGGRFFPGFGGKVVSVMAGMYNVSVLKFLWTTALANLAGSITMAATGWGLIQLF